jgi:hypothetical protein
MSVKQWVIGQTVVIHGPDKNHITTKITNIGRKLVTAKMAGYSNDFQFDATFDVPIYRTPGTGSAYYMYTIAQSEEVIFVERVLRILQVAVENYSHLRSRPLPFPMELLVSIGDKLGVPRPKHLEAKEHAHVSKTTVSNTSPSSGDAVKRSSVS